MANTEISTLGRDAHAIESPRSTFSLQSYMLILYGFIYLPQVIFERESACVNPLIPWPIFLLLFSSHLLTCNLFTCTLFTFMHFTFVASNTST